MIKRILFIVGMSLSVASCGVGLEDSVGSDTARDQKNDKLRAEYEGIKGTYEGNLRLPGVDRTFPIQLFLFWGEVQEAPRPGDLKPGIRVVLRGRLMFQKLMGDSDNLILEGQFDSVTGRLNLDPNLEISKTSSGCRLGGQDPISISARVQGTQVIGSVLRNGSSWAELEQVHFVSRATDQGAVLSEEEEFKRLKEIYASRIGMYRGELVRQVCDGQVRAEKDFELWIYIHRVQEGMGANSTACFVPRLQVRALRSLAGQWADVSYRSIGRFDPESILPQFQGNGVRLDLIDKSDSEIDGVISTSGRWGEIHVKKYRDEVLAPEDESDLLRSRLMKTFNQYTAARPYVGMVDAAEGRDWPTSLRLYVDEGVVDGIVRPFLKALYKRTDSSDDTIGSRLMDVTLSIDSCRPIFTMRSEPNPTPPGGIPGVGLMRYTATYDPETRQLSGELVDHRGYQGVMTVKRP